MLHEKVNHSCISPEERNLELINVAIEATKQAIYTCGSETAKAHLEYVIAFLNESWIAESGLECRKSKDVFADVAYMEQVGAAFSKLHNL